jgi:type IV secretion system protein VirB8
MALGAKKKDGADQYFVDARDWDHDRALQAHGQKRIAYLVAGAGVLFGLAMLIWHVAFPLRSIEPYIIRVDRTTGATDVMTRLSNTRDVTTDEAVNKFFLAEYVKVRETWVEPAAAEMMRRALSLSTAGEQTRFIAQRAPDNPNAPMVIYGKEKSVSVAIRSISFINPRVAQVRFVRNVSTGGALQDGETSWTATINFKYLDRPVTEIGRLDNPLGFQVVSYRADQELVP